MRDLILALALLSASPPAAAAGISVIEETGGRQAVIEVEGCRAALEVAAKWHSMRLRDQCPATVIEKAARFARLLARLFPDRRLPPEIGSLGLGRLVHYPELSGRAALAIRASGNWDGYTLRFRDQASMDSGAMNRPFAETLDRERLFAPFLEALRPYGVVGGTSSVEKVLVGPPAVTPAEEMLFEAGVGLRERLPFDAQVWLSLKRAGAP